MTFRKEIYGFTDAVFSDLDDCRLAEPNSDAADGSNVRKFW